MIAAALLQAVGAAQPAPAAVIQPVVFAPPLDRAMRYRLEQTRTVGGNIRRFAVERRVVFRRATDAGLVAELTITAIEPPATDGISRRFRASIGALAGRTLVFHLDAAGRVTAVDEADAVWDALVAGIAANAATLHHGIPAADDPAAPLRALPPAARLSVIASALTPLIAARDAAAAPSSRATTIPGTAVGGATAPLAGTRTVTRPTPGRVVITTTATGERAAAPLRLDRRRLVDAATGLLVEEEETVESSVGGVVQRTVTQSSLAPW